MAQPIAKYNGKFITCYPGSNQTDDGKLNLEKNMARIVTRLSSKNFCIVKPSFEIESITNVDTGVAQLRVHSGQASINGMDIIAQESIIIDAPETEGTYYLALKLARDSSWNVLGDFKYGTSITFEGVYLTYFDEKPDPIDPDMLYLGKVTWDGVSFSDIVEDEDKYGRIWAEDILCKINDPKHPDISRLNLQQWLNKVPDWYFSKEGDVIYGAAEFLPGRNGSNKPGIKLQALNENETLINIKAPSSLNDLDKNINIKSTNEGNEIQFSSTNIKSNNTNNYDFDISSKNNININSKKELHLEGKDKVKLTSQNTNLEVLPNQLIFNSAVNDELLFKIDIASGNIKQTLGKAIWQYNNLNQKVSLLSDNVSFLEIIPRADFISKTRIKDTLYLGKENSFGLEKTYLNDLNWRLTNTSLNSYIDMLANKIELVNSSNDNISLIKLRDENDSKHSIINHNGQIELKNNNQNPQILFTDGNPSYNSTFEKIKNEKKLRSNAILNSSENIISDKVIIGKAGIETDNGVITFVKGSNNATIIKDNNSSALRTSADLYIGNLGTNGLYAGNTKVKGTLQVGNNAQLKIDNSGNLESTGTIRASKVYNAVYNDIVEFMEKADYNENIEAGDIVFFTSNGTVTKYKPGINIKAVAGIVSSEDTYGYALGGDGLEDNQKVPIALKGRVYAKTKAVYLQPGDLLGVNLLGELSSVKEYNQLTLGIATQPESDGKVLVMIK